MFFVKHNYDKFNNIWGLANFICNVELKYYLLEEQFERHVWKELHSLLNKIA